jgi:hypothetical protein
MASTTNYAWSTPDNSGLVKNGAQDIRTLGDAIDTAVWNVGYGQAGKNKIINGNFGIWQRGTSFSNPANASYLADRYNLTYNGTGATRTISQQTFTPGTAPVAGYEGQYFFRYDQSVAGSGGTFSSFRQFIEDVRTFAGQTITFSYWAKAATGVTLSAPFMRQNFGSGGSSTVDTNFSSGSTLTTSWQRFTHTMTVPSISGKTVGAGSYLAFSFVLPLNTTFTIDVWGMQLEAGSVATPFQTASGSIAGELALAQRYYYRNTVPSSNGPFGMGFADSTSTTRGIVQFPVEMRTNPTALEQNGTASDYSVRRPATNVVCTAVPTFSAATKNTGQVAFTTGASLVTGEGLILTAAAVTTAYLGWSAEL